MAEARTLGPWALWTTVVLAAGLVTLVAGPLAQAVGLAAAGSVLGAVGMRWLSGRGRVAGPGSTTPPAAEEFQRLEAEMRTHLAALRAGVELAEGTASSDEQLEYLQAVRTAAGRLQTLVEDLVAGTEGDAVPEERAFSLQTLLGDVAHELAPVARREELELLCEVDPSVPDGVRGDDRALREVLRRLLAEAVRATGTGAVRLSVSPAGRPQRLRFRITGTGPAADAGTSGASTMTAESERARSIAVRMSRRLGARLEESGGSGSGVHFELDVELPEDARGRALFPGGESIEGLRVLVLEPEPESRRVLGEQLLALGMRPVLMGEARAAHEALHRATAADEPFALVILDPATRGSGVFRARRAGDDAVVASTPQLQLWSPPRRGREGPVGPPRLLRPVLPADLATAVRRALVPRRRAQRLRTRSGLKTPAALRILVVEPNALNALLTVRMLGLLGHQADVVRSGHEALEVIGRSPPDLVLMDVQMPQLDGLDATRELRAREARLDRARVPVLGLTTIARPDREAACLEAGMDGSLLMPFDTRALRQAIDHLFPEKTDRREPAGQAALDVARLRKRLGGDGEAASDVLAQFLDQCPVMLDGVRRAVVAGDAAALEQTAHRLKGTLLWIAADTAAATAGALELQGRRAELASAGETLDALESQVGEVCGAIQTARESLSQPS